MTAEVLAAVIGTSAGVGSVVGGWVALWWHDRPPTGHKRLLRYVFSHVDDRIGATAKEKVLRAGARFRFMRKWWLWWIPRPVRLRLADLLWFEPQFGGVTVLPGTRRMARYVSLEFNRPYQRLRPYRLHDIHAVVVRPSSEVNPHRGDFAADLARWVAWALKLTGTDQLEVEARPELGYWRLARRGPAPEVRATVPFGVGADA